MDSFEGLALRLDSVSGLDDSALGLKDSDVSGSEGFGFRSGFVGFSFPRELVSTNQVWRRFSTVLNLPRFRYSSPFSSSGRSGVSGEGSDWPGEGSDWPGEGSDCFEFSWIFSCDSSLLLIQTSRPE